MHRGYVKIYRCLHENEIWTKEPFSRGQAWIDLLLLANHKRGAFRLRGNRVTVERGQLGWAEESLAKRWQWSRGKVRRFLKELEDIDQQIVQQKSRIISLITILNYDKYQDKPTADDTTDDTTDGQQTIQQTDTNKNVKNVKNVKKKGYTAIPDDFRISPAVEKWAAEKGHSRLTEHLESFKLKARAKGYTYKDWDAAFMNAITDDWAKIRTGGSNGQTGHGKNNGAAKAEPTNEYSGLGTSVGTEAPGTDGRGN